MGVFSMVLAHSIHSIKSRSRNKCRNLWVGWCVSSCWPWFWPMYFLWDIHTKVGVAMLVYLIIWYCYCFLSGFKCTFSCIIQYSLYHNMDTGTKWHCTLVSSFPSQSIGLFCGCALFWSCVSLGAAFIIFLVEFYFIMIFTIIVVTIIGIFMAINYF